MKPFEPRLILVPTDLSEAAAHALRYASSLSERLGTRLLVIHADPFIPPTDFTAATAAVVALSRDAMMAAARRGLQEHAEQNVSSRVPFELRVIVGEPLDAIVAQARESGADLVVMGTHGRTGVKRLMFGSVTEAVMRVVSVPVIAVNPAAADTAQGGKVLVPVNFTPVCRDALRQAAMLASGPGTPLILLRTVDDEHADIGIEERHRMHDWLPAELADRCEMKLISSAHEADRIVEAAKSVRAQLIAFGVTGRTAGEPLLGTTAEQVVQRSYCPVLTVNSYAKRLPQGPTVP
jgi:nucleotide-binding universal stress UspA family protein